MTFLHHHGHYELMDPARDREMLSKLFFDGVLQQLANADKTWPSALHAHKEQEIRASEEQSRRKGGISFIRNDPGRWRPALHGTGWQRTECCGRLWTGYEPG